MHGFDQSVCGCVVCPESECMVLTSLCVAVWFVQRVNGFDHSVCGCVVNCPESECIVGLNKVYLHS